MFIKNGKKLLRLFLLLFLVGAVSVGIVLVSGKSALFTLPKADSVSQLGENCRSRPCASGLIDKWTNGVCTCYSRLDVVCGGAPNGAMGCYKNAVYKCMYDSRITVQDCSKTGDTCDVKNGGIFYCRIQNPGPKLIPIVKPKKESGCGSANSGACSGGTCPTGSSCKKSGGSCGCVKNK